MRIVGISIRPIFSSNPQQNSQQLINTQGVTFHEHTKQLAQLTDKMDKKFNSIRLDQTNRKENLFKYRFSVKKLNSKLSETKRNIAKSANEHYSKQIQSDLKTNAKLDIFIKKLKKIRTNQQNKNKQKQFVSFQHYYQHEKNQLKAKKRQLKYKKQDIAEKSIQTMRIRSATKSFKSKKLKYSGDLPKKQVELFNFTLSQISRQKQQTKLLNKIKFIDKKILTKDNTRKGIVVFNFFKEQ